tara:strand:+ start:974 stop:1261 length:288 start_codon:yes stop_codon:yes gene_type:complete
MDIYETLNLCEALQYYAPLYCLNYTSKEITLSVNHKRNMFENYLFCSKPMYGYKALCIFFKDDELRRISLVDDGVYAVHCKTYEECKEAIEAYFN